MGQLLTSLTDVTAGFAEVLCQDLIDESPQGLDESGGRKTIKLRQFQKSTR